MHGNDHVRGLAVGVTVNWLTPISDINISKHKAEVGSGQNKMALTVLPTAHVALLSPSCPSRFSEAVRIFRPL